MSNYSHYSLSVSPKSHDQNSKNKKQTNPTQANPYLEPIPSWQRKIRRTVHPQSLGIHFKSRRRTTCICVSEIFADVILAESGVAVRCGWRSRDVGQPNVSRGPGAEFSSNEHQKTRGRNNRTKRSQNFCHRVDVWGLGLEWGCGWNNFAIVRVRISCVASTRPRLRNVMSTVLRLNR